VQRKPEFDAQRSSANRGSRAPSRCGFEARSARLHGLDLRRESLVALRIARNARDARAAACAYLGSCRNQISVCRAPSRARTVGQDRPIALRADASGGRAVMEASANGLS
jgi:hypothetical protein